MMGKESFLKNTSRSLWRREGCMMTINELVAVLSLAVNAVRMVFDIVWKVYIEQKHAKKD